MLYYALVLRHPSEGNFPLPVAEITSDNSAPSIRAFVERFRRDESKLFNGKATMTRQVNTDYSRAITLAVLREFNEPLEMFLNGSVTFIETRTN